MYCNGAGENALWQWLLTRARLLNPSVLQWSRYNGSSTTSVINPYQSPLTNSDRFDGGSSRTTLVFVGFAVLCVLVGWLTRGTPYVTVIVTAAVAAVTLPFIRTLDRRRIIWCFVFGMVLSILGSIAFISMTHEPPNSYATADAFSDALDSILAYAISIGAILGTLIGIVMSVSSLPSSTPDGNVEPSYTEQSDPPKSPVGREFES